MSVPAGVTVALLTPVDERGQTDKGGLERLVSSVLAAGVTGISPLGSTGEGYSLSLAQRLEVVETVVSAAGPGVPVIPGIFGHNADLALAEITVCQAAGASAVLVAPPSYYPLAPAEQLAFFARVAEASPLPLVLYNIPPYTKVSIAPAVVAQLAAMKQVLAVKDSSRDFGYFLSVLDAVAAAGVAPEEFKVLTGTDSMLLSCLAAGGAGTICASANVVPELPVGICAAFAAGDLERARELERRLRRVLDICRAGSPPAGIKAAAAAAGLCGPAMVAPRAGWSAAEVDSLRGRLADLGPVPAAL
jgi:dihydrodipicolinate synthase/N-acetylneuraminate lyase